MVRKSMAALLMELGTHETLKKVIQEAREILSQGKAYAKNLIRAWIERKGRQVA
jgi:phosphoribosyl-ATP pyrophosphohydrolase